MPALLEYGAERVLICDQQGNTIDSRQGALDVIGDALGLGATLIAIPSSDWLRHFSIFAPGWPARSRKWR